MPKRDGKTFSSKGFSTFPTNRMVPLVCSSMKNINGCVALKMYSASPNLLPIVISVKWIMVV